MRFVVRISYAFQNGQVEKFFRAVVCRAVGKRKFIRENYGIQSNATENKK